MVESGGLVVLHKGVLVDLLKSMRSKSRRAVSRHIPQSLLLNEDSMFIAMNRFKITLGREQEFVDIWSRRETYLDTVPGFKQFHLLRGPTEDDHTLFASHSVWESREAFDAWTHSEAFRKAHASAGGAKGIYLGHPKLEGFESVL